MTTAMYSILAASAAPGAFQPHAFPVFFGILALISQAFVVLRGSTQVLPADSIFQGATASYPLPPTRCQPTSVVPEYPVFILLSVIVLNLVLGALVVGFKSTKRSRSFGVFVGCWARLWIIDTLGINVNGFNMNTPPPPPPPPPQGVQAGVQDHQYVERNVTGYPSPPPPPPPPSPPASVDQFDPMRPWSPFWNLVLVLAIMLGSFVVKLITRRVRNLVARSRQLESGQRRPNKWEGVVSLSLLQETSLSIIGDKSIAVVYDYYQHLDPLGTCAAAYLDFDSNLLASLGSSPSTITMRITATTADIFLCVIGISVVVYLSVVTIRKVFANGLKAPAHIIRPLPAYDFGGYYAFIDDMKLGQLEAGVLLDPIDSASRSQLGLAPVPPVLLFLSPSNNELDIDRQWDDYDQYIAFKPALLSPAWTSVVAANDTPTPVPSHNHGDDVGSIKEVSVWWIEFFDKLWTRFWGRREPGQSPREHLLEAKIGTAVARR